MRWNKNDHNEIGQERLTEEKKSKRVQKDTRVRDSCSNTQRSHNITKLKATGSTEDLVQTHIGSVHVTSFLVGTSDIWLC